MGEVLNNDRHFGLLSGTGPTPCPSPSGEGSLPSARSAPLRGGGGAGGGACARGKSAIESVYYLRLPLLAFFLFFHFHPSFSQNASLTLEPRRIEPGDTAVLRIMVSGVTAQPEGVDYGPWDSIIPKENILRRSTWERSGSLWVYKSTLIVFDSAVLQLPPINVRLHLGNTLTTNPIQFQVIPKPVSPDVAAIAPPRDILREPVLWTDYWPWALGALGLLLLLFWYLRRLKRGRPAPLARPIPAPEPLREIPAHELAFQQLEALARDRLWEKDELKTHYVRLSMLLREYLEKRFRVPALESTTREILPALKNAGFPIALNTSLRELLEQADMTKYARTPPPPEYHEKSLQNARTLIEKTV